MKIVEIRESTRPIKSNIRNAYIDFSKMTLSLVAVVTDVIRDGKPATPFMHFGDRVRIEMQDAAGHSIFGAIDQQVRPMP